MSTRVYGSLARIADFHDSNFEVTPLPNCEWSTGDYVEGEVIGTVTELYRMEDRSGHMVQVEPGDWIVGALGDRAGVEPLGRRLELGRGADAGDEHPREQRNPGAPHTAMPREKMSHHVLQWARASN